MSAAQSAAIDLYFWPTPNGFKITILLEELGVPYNVHFVNIGKGDQFKPDFLKISPNNKMPAIVDPEGPDGRSISVFESGAIMQYLGRKFDRFYPADERARVEVDQWLMWQMGGFGPMLGQFNHFVVYAPEKLPYAITRYTNEAHRLFGVLNTQLDGRDFVAGEYSIADMAIFGWARNTERYGVTAEEFPNVVAWVDRLAARPAVQKGVAVKAPEPPVNLADDKDAQKVLFNQRAR